MPCSGWCLVSDSKYEANEDLRQVNEGIRQKQEGKREDQERHGEDSRQTAETGRVDAERDRVAAEELRAENDRIMVLDPDFRIKGVTDEWLAMVERDRSIIGMNVFEAFPDPDPNEPLENGGPREPGSARLRESLHYARDKCKPHEMELLEYPIQLADGTWETRFWRVTNIPVCDKDGNLDHIINKVTRVRDLEAFREAMRRERDTDISLAVRRLRTWQNVLYAFMGALVIAFGWHSDRQGDRLTRQSERIAQRAQEATQDSRAGCDRQNALRLNQALLIEAQIATTDATLSHSLNGLEKFRTQIEQQNQQRRELLSRTRKSVADHPVKGEPYMVDCASAFPQRP